MKERSHEQGLALGLWAWAQHHYEYIASQLELTHGQLEPSLSMCTKHTRLPTALPAQAQRSKDSSPREKGKKDYSRFIN